MARKDLEELTDLSEDEVLDNEKDPEDAIAEIREAEAREETANENDTSQNSEENESEESGESESESDTSSDEDESKEKSSEGDEGETDAGTSESDEKESEDTGSEDEKEEKSESSKEAVTHKFKANGKDFEFTTEEIMEQFEGVFGKAMDYTQKMQKMAPFRKMISALEQQGVSENQLNLALDILRGDKDALKQLAKDKNIDLSDLSFEDGDAPYTPNVYGKDPTQLEIDEIETKISQDPEYKTTVDIIDKQWDDGSRQLIADNPQIILGLHNDVKSGVYAKVAPEAAKLQMLDGNSKSSLDYYLLAGAQLQQVLEAQNPQKKVDDLNKGAQEAESKFSKESSEAKNKRAANSTGSTSGKKGVIDYLDDDNDEKFDEWYKKLEASS